jgi:hypothetical protein
VQLPQLLSDRLLHHRISPADLTDDLLEGVIPVAHVTPTIPGRVPRPLLDERGTPVSRGSPMLIRWSEVEYLDFSEA